MLPTWAEDGDDLRAAVGFTRLTVRLHRRCIMVLALLIAAAVQTLAGSIACRSISDTGHRTGAAFACRQPPLLRPVL